MSDNRVFMISDSQRTGVINYLMKRPYEEVAQGVQMLLSLPECVDYVDAQGIQPVGEENRSSA